MGLPIKATLGYIVMVSFICPFVCLCICEQFHICLDVDKQQYNHNVFFGYIFQKGRH